MDHCDKTGDIVDANFPYMASLFNRNKFCFTEVIIIEKHINANDRYNLLFFLFQRMGIILLLAFILATKLKLINFQCVSISAAQHTPTPTPPPLPSSSFSLLLFYHFLIFLLAYFNEFQLAFIIILHPLLSMLFLTAKLSLV